MVFLVTFVVPRFASLYTTAATQLPAPTRLLMAIGAAAEQYIVVGAIGFFAAIIGIRIFLRTQSGQEWSDRVKMRTPIVAEIWTKYQVAQLARLLSTLLTGGIPLVQGMETAAQSVGSPLLRRALARAQQMVKEGSRSRVRGEHRHRRSSAPGHRHDRGGEHRRAALYAQLGGRVLRGRRQHADAGHAYFDRAGHHDLHGHLRGVCPGVAVPLIFSLAESFN